MQEIDLTQLATSLLFLYGNMFSSLSIDALLAQIQLILTIKTIYFVLCYVPYVEGIVDAIFAPFSFMHHMFHAHAAQVINNKYRDERGISKMPIGASISLGHSTSRNHESTNCSFMITNKSDITLQEAMYFANSSSAPAFVMILIMVSVGPLMQQLFFLAMHFYILIGISLCLLPSKADSRLIVEYIVVRGIISPWYVWNIYIAFFLTATEYALKYTYLNYYPAWWFVEPFLMGIWSVMSYLFLLSFLVIFSGEKKLFTEEEQVKEGGNKLLKTAEEREVARRLGFRIPGMRNEGLGKGIDGQTEINTYTTILDQESD